MANSVPRIPQQLPLFVLSKICATCKIEKSIDQFPKHKGWADGHNIHCRDCENARSRAKYQANIEKERQRNRAKPRESTRESNRKSYAKNRERINAERRERYATDATWKEYHLKRSQMYVETHPEQKSATTSAYYYTHKIAYQERNMRRNAHKKKAVAEKVDYDLILAQYGGWCHICNQEILPDQEINFDHVIPLDRNGTHAMENIRPSHGICNRRKHNKLMEELTEWDRRGP